MSVSKIRGTEKRKGRHSRKQKGTGWRDLQLPALPIAASHRHKKLLPVSKSPWSQSISQSISHTLVISAQNSLASVAFAFSWLIVHHPKGTCRVARSRTVERHESCDLFLPSRCKSTRLSLYQCCCRLLPPFASSMLLLF